MKPGKIVILGAGESGTGAAVLAKKQGFDVFVSDYGSIHQEYIDLLNNEDIKFEEAKHSYDLILNADEIIKKEICKRKFNNYRTKNRWKKIYIRDVK